VTVIARGREADIVAAGDGRVLRRYHGDPGGRPAREAAVMRHVRARGYPVPAVLEERPDALVLERIDGPTMADDAFAGHGACAATRGRSPTSIGGSMPSSRRKGCPRPATAVRWSTSTSIRRTSCSPATAPGSSTGRTRAGQPALDVALTWVILATERLDSAIARAARDVFVRAFLASFDRVAVRQALPSAVERRLADPHLRPTSGTT
jgi:hypothetical protein